MDASVLKTLKRIRKEAPRRFADLRNTCDEIIGMCHIISIMLPTSDNNGEEKLYICTTLPCLHISSLFLTFLVYHPLVRTAQLSAKDRISTSSGGGSSSSNANDVDADKYFAPLQAACESRQPRLMEIALDGIHNLIGQSAIFSLFAV